MTKNLIISKHLVLFLSLIFTNYLLSQDFLASQNISPQALKQLEGMSASQKKSIARQYGISNDGPSTESAYDYLLGEDTTQLNNDGFNENTNQYDDQALQLKKTSLTQDNIEEPKRFGLSFFDQDISTFSPVDNLSVPDNYILGIGDSLVIRMTGSSYMQFNQQIQRDGTIFIENLGSISLAGLTIETASNIINVKASNELFGSEFLISLGKLRAINIFLAGEVKNPGMYSVSSLTTVTQALYQAGGLTDLSSLRSIKVLRNGVTAATFDAYDLLIFGDASNDIRLNSGDVILVPPYELDIVVEGEAKRPMTYEILAGETVGDLITMSSGFSSDASPENAVLVTKRSLNQASTILPLNLLDENDLNVNLGVKDKLIIPKASLLPTNYTEVIGAANRPGLQAWYEGMKLSDLVSNIDEDFPQYVDLDFSLIVRKKDSFSDTSYIDFSLRNFFQDKEFHDFELNEFDRLIFFSSTPKKNDDIEPKRLTDLMKQKCFSDSGQPNRSYNLNCSSLKEEQMFESDNSRYLSTDSDKLDSSSNGYEIKEALNANDSWISKSESEVPQNLENYESSRTELLKPIIGLAKLKIAKDKPPKLVSVSGSVLHPGIYPLFDSASAADLIKAAGGLRDSAYEHSIELRRTELSKTGYLSSSLELDGSNKSNDLKNTLLKPLDHLTVRDNPGWAESRSVELSGEFRFPGVYMVAPGESIVSIISRAGGFTENAFVNGAVFTKAELVIQEKERMNDFANEVRKNFSSGLLTKEKERSISTVSVAEMEELLFSLSSIEPTGRVTINLNTNNRADLEQFILDDGDSLYVPPKTNFVNVIGEINRPSSHSFKEQQTVEDYLRLSGGLTKRADADKIYIIKANGSTVLLNQSLFRPFGQKPSIEPGDSIIAPLNIQYTDALTNWTQITQLVYQSMVSIAAVKGL